MSITLPELEALRRIEPAKARGDTADADAELGKCLLWRSPPSDRVSETRQDRRCELERLHPDKTRLSATPEMVVIEGTDLAKQRRILACNLQYS
jgi:hypothetical protein